MKRQLLCLSLCIHFALTSQTDIGGEIREAGSDTPLAWCAVGVLHSAKGCVSNENGAFTLRSVLPSDTLVISLTGYTTRRIAVAGFPKDAVIRLEPQLNRLAEVVVYANDDLLYNVFARCRQLLQSSAETRSKACFVMQSDIGDQPCELLECYYNATFTDSRISDLRFKNGRAGLADVEGRYFVNLNSSRAIAMSDLCNKQQRFPAIPFQTDLRQLKKQFDLRLLSVYDSIQPVYHIAFQPRRPDGKAFSGEAWIDKNSGRLRKVLLEIKSTGYHPFLPVFGDYGAIREVSMQIQKVYNDEALSHIYFDYQMVYEHRHSNTLINSNRDTVFDVACRGLMRFYDRDQLFYIPAFDYGQDESDYRKITGLSYNEGFWDINGGPLYSHKMQQALRYFKRNGILINYRKGPSPGRSDERMFMSKDLQWSADKRVALKKDAIPNDTLKQGQTPLVMAYQLSAQIYFDMNPTKDSVQHFSCTVFDLSGTWYNLREEPFTNCFLNLYFDLFEIGRRQMEAEMRREKADPQKLDAIYQRHVAATKRRAAVYLTEVERGKRKDALRKWNELVKAKLAIDNMALYGLKD